MKDEIKIYVKEPGEPAVLRTVPNTLEALQKLVGGYIEDVTVATDLVVICNDGGRLLGMPYNCKFCGYSFVGTVLFVGVDGEDFTDCPDLFTELLTDKVLRSDMKEDER